MKLIPKLGKDHCNLIGYRILTKQNTIGKLTEFIVARKPNRDLEDGDILPSNQRGGRGEGRCTWKNAAAFAYDVYE